MTRLHLIGNSHLDPVWLWDWREGLNEAVTTCRTVLRLMEEFPEMTYIRGEASTYEHIRRHDPATFERIVQRIAEGRWDVVGGSWVQPDTNLPATETLVRHYTRGLDYFQRTLGKRPTVAWSADSFGHSAGWPAIFAAAGMESYAFSRPFERDLYLEKPGFWWESDAGKRVLAWRIPIGWYGTERGEIPQLLDNYRKFAPYWSVENIAVFYGLGNHGGGPSRRQLREIRQWTEANPDVEVIHSGLHRFFAAVRAEPVVASLPVVRGELNFTLRGCYASAARYKFAYRRAENGLLAAEKTASAIRAAGLPVPSGDLTQAWDGLLFNTFHDILPGTSIERAFDDQIAWLGVTLHESQRAQLDALNALASAVDTSVPAPPHEDHPTAVPVLVWNPHPWTVQTAVEVEVPLDYRPIAAYLDKPWELPVEVLGANGAPIVFQRIPTEHLFCLTLAWRVRLVVPLNLPPLGWQVLSIGWNESAKQAAHQASHPAAGSDGPDSIRGGAYGIEARVGGNGITVTREGQEIFGPAGMTVATMEDPWGSWGGHDGETAANSISTVREVWRVEEVRVLESGPERAALWVRLGAGASRLELTYQLTRAAQSFEVSARLIWNERAARLKLLFPCDGEADFEVPGGVMRRGDIGEVPGGRWVRTTGFALFSDAFYNFESKDGMLNATVVRSCRYASSDVGKPEDLPHPHRPYMDQGEHRFRFALTTPDADLFRLADQLEQPPVVLPVWPHAGNQPSTGTLGELLTGTVHLLAFKPAENAGGGFILRLQDTGHGTPLAEFRWLDATLTLGPLGPLEIGSWRLVSGENNTWRVERMLADEVSRDT